MRVRPLFKDEVATGTRRCMSLCGLDEQSALNRANYSARSSSASPVSGMSADTSDVNGTRKWLNQALSEFSNNNFKKGISLISIMPDSDIEIEAKPLFTGNKS